MKSLLALLIVATLLLALLPVPAAAQEADIEAAIGESRSGASTRELQQQANAEPPRTADPHELAIFHHKRGMANRLLGNYARAIEDLRFALENTQPKKRSPGGWGNR